LIHWVIESLAQFPGAYAWAKRFICPIQIEKLRVEVSSDPFEETLMFFVSWISDGFQEFRVPERASTIFWRRVSRPCYAHRVLNARVGHQDGFQQEIVVPVVAEIVMIVKASADL
jgi:hypothetical protein